jgi:hypothetical protein
MLMKFLIRLLEAMMHSRQLQAASIICENAHFAQEARAYELSAAATETVSGGTSATAGAYPVPINGLAA